MAKTTDSDLPALLREFADYRESRERFAALDAMKARYEFHDRINDITRDDIEATRANLSEFLEFDDGEVERWQKPEQVYDLLYTQRSYQYSFYSYGWEKLVPVEPAYRIRLNLWIRELAASPAFRVVHLRQGRYYPAFATRVNWILYSYGDFVRREVEAAEARDQERRLKADLLKPARELRAKQLEEAQGLTRLAFDQIVDDLYYSFMERELVPERLARLRKIFEDSGSPSIPLDRRTFREVLRPQTAFLEHELRLLATAEGLIEEGDS